MTKDILLNVPLVNQRTDTGSSKWAKKTCGICSLKMILDFYYDRSKNTTLEKKLKSISVSNLIEKGLKRHGYLTGVGWKHKALVELASEYDVKVNFQKIFPKTHKEKTKKLKFIDRNIKDNKPVIVSIFYRFDYNNGGHLVVINGIRFSSKGTAGYYIQDPDPSFRGSNYFVSKKELLAGWRGGVIWLE